MEQPQIDEIVSRVVTLIYGRLIAQASPRRVLMLFSGASTGYVVGMETIRLLSQSDHRLTVLLTASAEHVIGLDNVRAAGATDILGPQQWVDTPALVRAADLVLVPTLSMNTAARLALGLMDSLFSTLVLGALLDAKPVIAIRDGADPYGNGGLIFSDSPDGAPTLRAKLAGYLETLGSYGVDLVTAEAFTSAVVRELVGKSPAPRQAAPDLGGAAALPQPHNGRATIVTAGDLAGYAAGTAVHLPANTRLTPLAQEQAARGNLKLFFG